MSHDDRHEPDRHVHGGSAQAAAATVVDPVCGMDVMPGEAEGGSASTRASRTGFATRLAASEFVADPAKYLPPSARRAARPRPR